MTKEFIEKWYNNIPEIERDLPIIYYEGKVYTPEEIYNEVMNGTEIGEKLQEELEKGYYGLSNNDEAIRKAAEERVKEIIKRLPDNFSIVSIKGIVIGKDELFEALKDSAIEIEEQKIRRLLYG